MNVPVAEIASTKVPRQNMFGLFKGYGTLRTQCSWSRLEGGHVAGDKVELLAGAEHGGPCRP